MDALTHAVTYRIVDDQLEIDNAAGETTLIFVMKEQFAMNPADLIGTGWQLLSLGEDSLIEGSTITLVFESEQAYSGYAGCRSYSGTYEATGGDIRFPYIAMLEENCPDQALLEQEGRYTDSLTWATNYRLGEGKLEIFTAQGKVLVFAPLQ